MSLVVNIHHLSGSLAGQRQRLSLEGSQVVRLGRNAGNDIKYNEEIEDNVSGTHAELSAENGRLFIEDKRSSNGTFVNGATCPPFQRIAVPDGSRIRLAQDGPEMQVTVETASQKNALSAPSPHESSLPPKQTVGRDTLLREIDRAKHEERAAISSTMAQGQRKTRLIVGAVAAFLLALVAVGGSLLYLITRKSVDDATAAAAAAKSEATRNVWQDVERAVSPAVAFVRCRYYLEQHRGVDANGTQAIAVRYASSEVSGSAVLIRPGLLLTAKHVVEPWKYSFAWEQTPYEDWDDFARKANMKPVVELLEIQFPGFQAIAGTVSATSETSDLALVSVPQVNVQPVPVVLTNQSVNVTDEVAIIGYPRGIGRVSLITLDRSSAGATFAEVSTMEPTFFKGTVTRTVPEVGETSHLFSIDASIEPGNSGGPVVNNNGEVIGIVVARLVATEKGTTVLGVDVAYRVAITSAGQAASPGDIEKFLRRVGVL